MITEKLISRFGLRILSSIFRPPTKNYSTPADKCDDDCYKIVVNVSKFSLEEIKVRTGQLTTVNVEAIQKREDEQGFSSNYVSMQYVVPTTHDGEKLEAKLISGVLVLTVPKFEGNAKDQLKTIEIQQ